MFKKSGVKIFIYSQSYYPTIGGLERMANLICRALVERGHQVLLATNTAGTDADPLSFPILRKPTMWQMLQQTRRADICISIGVSLRAVPLFLAMKKTTIVSHHTWLGQGARSILKGLCARLAYNVFCSHSLANVIRGKGCVIGSAYDEYVFRDAGAERSTDACFVGRLVSDKGCHILLNAIRIIKATRPDISVLVIGEGEDRGELERLSFELDINSNVVFAGVLEGSALASALNSCKMMVVPSTWKEPFGIVALEGAAAGCFVIATAGGGLPEAVGPCGVIVPPDSPRDLAVAMEEVFSDAGLRARARLAAPSHLKQFSESAIGSKYVEIIEREAGFARHAKGND